MKRFVALFALCALLSWPLWSQDASLPLGSSDLASLPDFDDSFVYQVQGSTLNRWKAESTLQAQALQEALSSLDASEAHFSEVSKAISELRTLFATYRRSTEVAMIADLVGGFAFGLACGYGLSR
jgi:hypothetical protein